MHKKEIILITGVAGFIGFHICKKLLNEYYKVIGIDNFNNYYDVKLKKSRIKELELISKSKNNNFICIECDLVENTKLNNIFEKYNPSIVINLAAQAGVRFSIDNPSTYIKSNLVGFGNLLECCRANKIKHLIYASSSSVYGGNTKIPFSEKDSVDHPVSLYAATKKSNELLAHTYSHIFGLSCTGLRFFTVYGPWGRPDMSPMIFTKCILSKKPLKIFNNGEMFRDFTYIDDVVEIIFRLLNKPALSDKSFNNEKPNPQSSWAPYKIFNIGNSKSVYLLDFIKCLEEEIGIKAIKDYVEMQPGDVKATEADTSEIESYVDFKPQTSLENGIKNFYAWYKKYYK